MRIGFIYPTNDYLFDPFRGDPLTHFQILTAIEVALGDTVELLLIDLRGIKKEFIAYRIPECDVYLYSIYTRDYNEQVSIVEAIRERFKKAVHIAGGPHANIYPEESLTIFDALVLGEGELVVVDAIRDFLSNSLKKIYRQTTPLDINQHHYPLRRYLPASTIARPGLLTLKNKPEFGNLLSATAIFSRGCPYSCYFCTIGSFRSTTGIRFRHPNLIEQEIEYLKKEFRIQAISLHDEIAIPPKYDLAVKHLEAIGRTNIVWRGSCRVDGITNEIAKLTRQSGCRAIGMGVESVSQKSLDLINKKITVNKSRETIRMLKENDIEPWLYMIIGLPAEPEDIVEQTWSFIQETKTDLVYLSLFTVRPGTILYNDPKRFGFKRVSVEKNITMHVYDRYGEEKRPELTFEYEENAPWGKSISAERIIDNYLELQKRLRNAGLSSLNNPRPLIVK